MEPDMDIVKEQQWDRYIEWCHRNGVAPKPDGFTIWLEEQDEGMSLED